MGGFPVTRARKMQRPPGRTVRATPFKYMGGWGTCVCRYDFPSNYILWAIALGAVYRKEEKQLDRGEVM